MPTLDPTLPYPWPYDGCLDPNRLALVVAGAQAGWADASEGAAAVALVLDDVARAIRAAGGLVVLIHHTAARASAAGRRPSSVPPAPHTAAAEPALLPEPGDLVVPATGVDGFHGGPLDGVLRGHSVDHLVLAGFGAEAAVDSTLRSANDRGYECLTLTDAVAPFDPFLGRHALSSITMSGGIFGAIGPSAALLAALAPARSSAALEAL